MQRSLRTGDDREVRCGNLALKLACGVTPVTPVTLARLTGLLHRDLMAPGVPAAYGEALAEVLALLDESHPDAPTAVTTADSESRCSASTISPAR